MLGCHAVFQLAPSITICLNTLKSMSYEFGITHAKMVGLWQLVFGRIPDRSLADNYKDYILEGIYQIDFD